MPSTSKKQHNFMAAVAKNPQFAKKVGLKQSVGKHFLEADKGKKFREGGMAKEKMHSEKGEMKQDIAQDKKLIKRAFKMHDKQEHKGGKGTSLAKLCTGGMAMKKAKRYEDGGEVEFETKTGENKNIGDDVRARAMKAMAEGGAKDEMPKAKPRAKAKPKANAMTSSMSRMNPMGDTYKAGGKVRGCGIAKRGLTKGKIV